MPRRQTQLAEVVSTAQRGAIADLHKVTAGIVRGYHASVAGESPASVDVEVAIHDVRDDGEGGLESEPWGILPEVPLACLNLGGFSIRAAAKAGDRVLLVSYDLDPTKHVLTGEVEDPLWGARHVGGYWIAIPFDITCPGALEDPGSELVVGQPGGTELRLGSSGVKVTAPSIDLGGGATDFAALASLVAANFAALAIPLNLMAAQFNAGPGPMASLGPGSVTPFAPSPVAATVTKAK